MGIMSEMTNEAIDSAMNTSDLEEETDQEVENVLNEILMGNFEKIQIRLYILIFRFIVIF